MKIVTLSAAACAAVIVLAGGAAPAIAVAADTAAAQRSDYADFRKLAEPLRLIDVVIALNYDQVRNNSVTRDKSQKWRDAFLASVERGVRERRDLLTDAVMQHAYAAFSPQEISRLVVLGYRPFVARYQAAKIDAMRNDQEFAPIQQQIISGDADYLNMTASDHELISRLLYEIGVGIAQSSNLMRPMYEVAFRDAAMADPQPLPPGVIPVPPVPVNPVASPPSDDGQVTEGAWTIPTSKEMDAVYPAVAKKQEVEGRAVVNCEVTATGRLVRCVVESETPQGYGFGAATIAVYQARAHVDPASIRGGVKPGAHKRFTVRWQLG